HQLLQLQHQLRLPLQHNLPLQDGLGESDHGSGGTCNCGPADDGYVFKSSKCMWGNELAGCFKIYDTPGDDETIWEDAEERCRKEGAHLSRWNSPGCLNDIQTYFREQNYPSSRHFWTCAQDPPYNFTCDPTREEFTNDGKQKNTPGCYTYHHKSNSFTEIFHMQCQAHKMFMCQRLCSGGASLAASTSGTATSTQAPTA
ncbi:unnamed protein product, partial [Owenia fusiformis]